MEGRTDGPKTHTQGTQRGEEVEEGKRGWFVWHKRNNENARRERFGFRLFFSLCHGCLHFAVISPASLPRSFEMVVIISPSIHFLWPRTARAREHRLAHAIVFFSSRRFPKARPLVSVSFKMIVVELLPHPSLSYIYMSEPRQGAAPSWSSMQYRFSSLSIVGVYALHPPSRQGKENAIAA